MRERILKTLLAVLAYALAFAFFALAMGVFAVILTEAL